MARLLHDRLAFASYKAHHGQEDMCLDDVEATLDITISQRRLAGHDATASSPIKDAYRRSAEFDAGEIKAKRLRSQSNAPLRLNTARNCSWKSAHRLPQSSPLQHTSDMAFCPPAVSRCESDACIMPDASATYIAPSSPSSPPLDSSPPRTPVLPPQTRLPASLSRGEEGADLLLYLATSPSPATGAQHYVMSAEPSTPPPRTGLGSASTAKGSHPSGLAPHTPGQTFNFADFVNITPSPAPGRLSCRNGSLAKTPIVASEAHRRLNSDGLVAPRAHVHALPQGRGMELEGAFMSS